MARERDYQLGIVISPEIGEDQARVVVDRVNTLVAANGGQVFRVLAWGRRRLAYPIEHHRDGLYYWFDMQLPPEKVAEVERNLRVIEAIMRHLLTLREARVVAQERVRAEEAEARAAAQQAEGEVSAREPGAPEIGSVEEPVAAEPVAAEVGEPDEAGEPVVSGEYQEEPEV